jgi:uncharacterized RDD family membrane protein YckC
MVLKCTEKMSTKTLTATKKASFWKRMIALYIDVFILTIFSGLIGVVFSLSDTSEHWIYFALFYTYNIFMDNHHQATLGKKIVRIKVVKTDGTKPDLLSAFYRNFGKMVSIIPLGYGYLRILAPHQRQTIHDELGKCLVIESN